MTEGERGSVIEKYDRRHIKIYHTVFERFCATKNKIHVAKIEPFKHQMGFMVHFLTQLIVY